MFTLETPGEIGLQPFLEQFRTDPGGREPDALIRVDEAGKNYLLTADLLGKYGLRRRMLEKGLFVLHASYIVHEGCGILFSGASGIGKSFQAGLWERCRGARIVNGDRVLIEERDGRFTANGIFYCGSSGICENVTTPLKAVVILERGASTVRRPVGIEAFKALLPQCAYDVNDPREVESVTRLLADLIGCTPVYVLSAAPDESSVIALENAMEGET